VTYTKRTIQGVNTRIIRHTVVPFVTESFRSKLILPWNHLIPTCVPRNSGNSVEYPEFQKMRTGRNRNKKRNAHPRACCDHKCRVGRPQTTGKNLMVENLCLLFRDIPTVQINRHGSLRSWIHEASNEKYWYQLVDPLLHPATPVPERPADWGPLPSRQARRATNSPHQMKTLPTAMMRQPQTTRKNKQGHRHAPKHRNNLTPQRPIMTQNDGSTILLSVPWSDEACPTRSRFSV
jgi:hypothetical protein